MSMFTDSSSHFWSAAVEPPNAQAHRELPNRSLSRLAEPPPGSDAMEWVVSRPRLSSFLGNTEPYGSEITAPSSARSKRSLNRSRNTANPSSLVQCPGATRSILRVSCSAPATRCISSFGVSTRRKPPVTVYSRESIFAAPHTDLVSDAGHHRRDTRDRQRHAQLSRPAHAA